uniref:Transcriptional adapter 1 n=1 Tax=Syphacia muris TaxID=451379 RepID=A0A0N5AWG5_9BILA
MSKRCYDDDEEVVNGSDMLLNMRKQIKEVLGEQKSLMYFKCLKDWIRGRKQQDEFDSYGLALMPGDKVDLHTQFFLAILEQCELSLDYITNEKGIALPASNKNFVSHVIQTKRKSYDRTSFHAESSEHGNSKFCKTSTLDNRWLPHKGQVKGRLLLAAWESGLEKVSEDTIDLIVISTKILMMNLLEACVRLKRNHLVTESGATYSYGILNRSNSKPSSRAILPCSEPISARDLLDAIQIERPLMNNQKLWNNLITLLKAADAGEARA